MENKFTFTGEFSGPAVAAVLTVEMILALIANGVVLSITLYQRKSWKQSSTIFFTSLILAHLVLNVLYLPFTIIALAAGEWIFGSTDDEKTRTCSFCSFTALCILLIIVMTVAAISFDRFLFIVKPHLHKQFMRPWVALTLTIAIWTLSAVLSSTPFYGLGNFNFDELLGFCFPLWISVDFIVYSLIIALLLFSVIIVTSVWTLCFTHRFITQQSQLSNDDTYGSKKKWLLGIFGSMLLVYGICFLPIANPIVQSYFRPEIKTALIANSVVLFITLYQKKSWKQSSTIFFTSLILAHLVLNLLLWFGASVITITLAAISFDQFFFIVKPHLHKQFMRPWVALTLTIAIWILSAVLSSGPFSVYIK
uniref:G-protein coupled receptors family 1 profile domain-containing protein n=1 Tax=Amphimedon queenslandica TaxID=400682 RepID=A0A1X7TU65_AMPQE